MIRQRNGIRCKTPWAFKRQHNRLCREWHVYEFILKFYSLYWYFSAAQINWNILYVYSLHRCSIWYGYLQGHKLYTSVCVMNSQTLKQLHMLQSCCCSLLQINKVNHSCKCVRVCLRERVLHGVFYASWTEKKTNPTVSLGKVAGLSVSLKVSIILATVIELHSCYYFSTRVPSMKEREREMGEGSRDVAGESRASKQASEPSSRGMQKGK